MSIPVSHHFFQKLYVSRKRVHWKWKLLGHLPSAGDSQVHYGLPSNSGALSVCAPSKKGGFSVRNNQVTNSQILCHFCPSTGKINWHILTHCAGGNGKTHHLLILVVVLLTFTIPFLFVSSLLVKWSNFDPYIFQIGGNQQLISVWWSHPKMCPQ